MVKETEVILFLGHTSTVVHVRSHVQSAIQSINKLIYSLTDYAWDRKQKRFVPDRGYFKMYKELGLFILPKNYTEDLVQIFEANDVKYIMDIVEEVDVRKISMNMKAGWVDRPDQIGAIKHLTNKNVSVRCLALQTGCIAGDGEIALHHNDDQYRLTMREALKRFDPLQSSAQVFTSSLINDKIALNEVEEITYSGKQMVYKLTLENGLWLKCTLEHLIMTNLGWKCAKDCLGFDVMYEDDTTHEGYGYSRMVSWTKVGVRDTYDAGCKSPNNNFIVNKIVVHNSGKTYSAIKSAVLLGEPFMVITSRLVDQWVKAIKDQTDIQDEDIYVIKGLKSIFDILRNDLKPKCVIASLETMRNFCNGTDDDINMFMLCNQIGIGTKIVDECHENFHAIVMIDMMMNIRNNIYLSATYMRNNASTNKIFNKIFPREERYGEGEYKKYANVKMFAYSSFTPEKLIRLGGSYNHYKYESFLLRNEKSVNWFCGYILNRVINERYIRIKKDGQRLLIIMGKRDNIYLVVKRLRELYPLLTIMPYTQDEGEDSLDADIIVSTLGSAGTGRHINDLVSMIMTVSMEAEGKLRQAIGRLRELKDSVVYYSDIYNESSTDHVRHKEGRERLYRKIAAVFSLGKL